ncbi:hypothetical protein BDN72DRAFT_956184 [Pluteus cervinus]|uniref:Uncharacterized protein n=1 Tax=Pluteus cervinus TaxID=181527 RepID=A0ACD3B7N0_9AGAR|nr:hypothetical protein BDN72DRAFT_956184 [Pluteus cervinus]
MAQPPPADREAISTSVTVSKRDGSQETIFQSKHFCGSDADVTIISNDDVRFQLHKKNLAFCTGGFPPVEFSKTSDEREEVNLSERGYILDLLFHFVYPQRYPNLATIHIDVLSELAEAAEKYQVFGAISVCQAFMILQIPNHPIDVFAYATWYDYLDIADRVAPLVLGTPLNILAERLPPAAVTGWARYLVSWDTVRSKWTALILDSITATSVQVDRPSMVQYTTTFCKNSRGSRALLTELAKHMVPQTKLLDLAAAVVCNHCKSSYADNLIREAPTLYSQFAKFNTFLH